jgi:hypothetical protein
VTSLLEMMEFIFLIFGIIPLLVLWFGLALVLLIVTLGLRRPGVKMATWLKGAWALVVASLILLTIWDVHRTTFNSQRWKDADRGSISARTSVRYDMLADLERKHPLVGMSKPEVLELLGPPAPPGFPFEAAKWDMTYQLRPTLIDNLWLLIRFREGKVVEYKVYED